MTYPQRALAACRTPPSPLQGVLTAAPAQRVGCWLPGLGRVRGRVNGFKVARVSCAWFAGLPFAGTPTVLMAVLQLLMVVLLVLVLLQLLLRLCGCALEQVPAGPPRVVGGGRHNAPALHPHTAAAAGATAQPSGGGG